VDGLTLHVPIHSTASPGCVDSTTASAVGAGPIEPGSVIPGTPPAGESSPLRLLRATAHDYPRTVAPGQVLKFVIALPRFHPAGDIRLLHHHANRLTPRRQARGGPGGSTGATGHASAK
jgi:hypothetical protein